MRLLAWHKATEACMSTASVSYTGYIAVSDAEAGSTQHEMSQSGLPASQHSCTFSTAYAAHDKRLILALMFNFSHAMQGCD